MQSLWYGLSAKSLITVSTLLHKEMSAYWIRWRHFTLEQLTSFHTSGSHKSFRQFRDEFLNVQCLLGTKTVDESCYGIYTEGQEKSSVSMKSQQYVKLLIKKMARIFFLNSRIRYSARQIFSWCCGKIAQKIRFLWRNRIGTTVCLIEMNMINFKFKLN
jgi:hypothetical protein